MTRLIGGLAERNRAVRAVAVGGSAIITTGIGETVAGSSRSVFPGAVIGAAGVGGDVGDSQSHRKQWQAGDSPRAVGCDVRSDSSAGSASSPQQDFFVVEGDAIEQQERFLAPGWQHDVTVRVGVAACCC